MKPTRLDSSAKTPAEVAMTSTSMSMVEPAPIFAEKSLHLSSLSRVSLVVLDSSLPSQLMLDSMVAPLR